MGARTHQQFSHRPQGGGSTATEEPGGGLVPTIAAVTAAALIQMSFKPPYLPALGGRAGTFPPFDFVSGGTVTRCRHAEVGGRDPHGL